jgi:hypothetical protein
VEVERGAEEMSIEAMKEAVAAFDKIIDGCNGIDEEDTHPEAKKVARLVRKDCLRALEALCQAIAKAEKQEPVAWMTHTPDGAEPEPKKWTATTPRLLSMLRDDILRQAIAEAEKQQPVVGTKTWFEDGKMVTQHLYASDIPQECVDETAKDRHEWGLVTDDALIEEVRRRGFTIRDAQISPKIKDEYELCCQKYDTCTEPCTPRGRHLAKRELVGQPDLAKVGEVGVWGDKREWVGLEEEEILKCFDSVALGQVEGDCVIDKHVNIFNAIRAVEAKLKEKNT